MGLCNVGWRFTNKISPFCICLNTVWPNYNSFDIFSLIFGLGFINDIFLPSFDITWLAPGYLNGPFFINFFIYSILNSFTFYRKCNLEAIYKGIHISPVSINGSGLITLRPEWFTFFPIIFILNIPSFFSIICLIPFDSCSFFDKDFELSNKVFIANYNWTHFATKSLKYVFLNYSFISLSNDNIFL